MSNWALKNSLMRHLKFIKWGKFHVYGRVPVFHICSAPISSGDLAFSLCLSLSKNLLIQFEVRPV